jgi:hypothetical protein
VNNHLLPLTKTQLRLGQKLQFSEDQEDNSDLKHCDIGRYLSNIRKLQVSGSFDLVQQNTVNEQEKQSIEVHKILKPQK